MIYVEKMVAEIGSKVANHRCNKNMAALIVEQIIADTKRACKNAYLHWYGARDTQSACMDAIDQAEVKEAK